jgi:hypothetical protein
MVVAQYLLLILVLLQAVVAVLLLLEALAIQVLALVARVEMALHQFFLGHQ